MSTSKKIVSKPRSSDTLRNFKALSKKQMFSKMNTGETVLVDAYNKAEESRCIIKKQTGIIFDNDMELHKCKWDKNYPERPERYRAVLNRCKELGLIDRCKILTYNKATVEDVCVKHDKELFDTLEQLSKNTNLEQVEAEASKYDAIYFNEHTHEAATIAAGCVISLVREICLGNVQNGMAIVRPPGHHAMKKDYCGYCYFNNVALAAQHALNSNLAKKILIVDYDVHHGQGTQQMFYEDNRVLYFSIHRYEHGTFWPNGQEGNFDFVGLGNGLGYNVNVPLNKTGLGDAEYMAIVHHILVPIAYEYKPDLIIVSAGYDACVGCSEGQMNVTPGFYGHLVTLLSGLAFGRIAICLEGGYFLPSLAEGASMTLKSLLGDPASFLEPMDYVKEVVVDVINNVKYILQPYWKCFHNLEEYTVRASRDTGSDKHIVRLKYFGTCPVPPYDTRNCYPKASSYHVEKYSKIIDVHKLECVTLQQKPVAYAYDEDMLLHTCESNPIPEVPERLRMLYNKFIEFGLDKRCIQAASRNASVEEMVLVHDIDYIKKISNKEFDVKKDIYMCDETLPSILKSTGCLLSVVDSVLNGSASCGAAFIRPPGHHAEPDCSSGFCFVNNVSVAAQYILEKYLIDRILIIDFDVHHGNGTQHIFYDSNKVMYLSVHRYENGTYFPASVDGNFDKIGEGPGEGYNINIPLNHDKMGNSDYLSIFYRIILPIAYSFAPQVVLVSAGFDAGVNDMLGNYRVTPEAYGHFIQLLKPLANGRIILALEGGYNCITVSYSMIMCVKALLGDPLPMLDDLEQMKKHTIIAINNVINTHKKNWHILKVYKKIPDRIHFKTVLEDGKYTVIEDPDCKLIKLRNTSRELVKSENSGKELVKLENTGRELVKLENTGRALVKLENTGRELVKSENTGRELVKSENIEEKNVKKTSEMEKLSINLAE